MLDNKDEKIGDEDIAENSKMIGPGTRRQKVGKSQQYAIESEKIHLEQSILKNGRN